MSDRAYAKVQAQQKTLTGSSPKRSLLQRRCACGGSPGIDGLCTECRGKRLASQSSRGGFEASSLSAAAQGNTPVQENVTSSIVIVERASRFVHDFSRIPVHYSPRSPVIQTKLQVNQPGDVYEQEADQEAEQVMRMTHPEASVPNDGDKTKNTLMPKQSKGPGADAAPTSPDVSPIVHAVLSSGGGQPLDKTTRAFGEPRFGHDFSRVRAHPDAKAASALNAEGTLTYTLHTVPQAAETQADEIARRVATPEQAREGELPAGLTERLGREIGGNFRSVRVHSDAVAADRVAHYGAEAMSEGRDLYFAAGRWRPDTQEGAFLAAHEAVHAAQQGFAERGVVRGEGRYFKKDPPLVNPSDILEELKRRAPDLAVFVDEDTLDKALRGDVSRGPTVHVGTSGTEVHEWYVELNPLPPWAVHSQTEPWVNVERAAGDIVKHTITLYWVLPEVAGAKTIEADPRYKAQADAAEKAGNLPRHAKSGADYAVELTVIEPLLHELLHARVIMERDPSFSAGAHSRIAQGYLDMIAASQRPEVSTQREAVQALIKVLAALYAPKLTKDDLTNLANQYDEFLVHEKYDNQKTYELMGKSGATNEVIAEKYSKIVQSQLQHVLRKKFGEINDTEADEPVRGNLWKATIEYYNAIDTVLAAPQPASQRSSAPSNVPQPATTVPVKPTGK